VRRKFKQSLVFVVVSLLMFVVLNFTLYGYYRWANGAALARVATAAERVENLRMRASALSKALLTADAEHRLQLDSQYADTVDGYNAVFEQWQKLRSELPLRRDLLLFW